MTKIGEIITVDIDPTTNPQGRDTAAALVVNVTEAEEADGSKVELLDLRIFGLYAQDDRSQGGYQRPAEPEPSQPAENDGTAGTTDPAATGQQLPPATAPAGEQQRPSPGPLGGIFSRGQ